MCHSQLRHSSTPTSAASATSTPHSSATIAAATYGTPIYTRRIRTSPPRVSRTHGLSSYKSCRRILCNLPLLVHRHSPQLLRHIPYQPLRLRLLWPIECPP